MVLLGAAGDTSLQGSFLQYGAIGLMAFVFGIAVWTLYKRLLDEYDREKQRADRLEQQLAQLNATIQGQITKSLDDANRAVAEAMSKFQAKP